MSGTTQAGDVVLRMEGINKAFNAIRALSRVDFEVRSGEVHALIGENGAGKSTLMNVLAGRFDDYEGRVTIAGGEVRLTNPRQALARGVAVIYQELSILPDLTVAENVVLGQEPAGRWPGTLDRAALNVEARALLDRLRFDLPVAEQAGGLSTTRQVLVEIARAMHRRPRIMVFDEPTAALGREDVQKLFAVIRDLRAHGLGIVYISHRLAELPQIADRVTVLRDGQVVGTRDMKDCKVSELTRLMLGRELAEMFPARANKPGKRILSVRNLARPGVFESVSFDLHEGEILALAGLVGSGRTEIARALVGADQAAGDCELDGRPLTRRTPERCRDLGLCMVPEDRKRDGAITGRPVAENLNAGILARLTSALGYLPPRSLRQSAARMIARMGVEPPEPATEMQKLSGGNQQKVIVGRTLAVQPKVFIFDEPTQGIDVGTKAEIYRLIVDLAASGRAVILISSEFIEICELADRILVIRDGRLSAELAGRETDEETLFAACVGEGGR